MAFCLAVHRRPQPISVGAAEACFSPYWPSQATTRNVETECGKGVSCEAQQKLIFSSSRELIFTYCFFDYWIPIYLNLSKICFVPPYVNGSTHKREFFSNLSLVLPYSKMGQPTEPRSKSFLSTVCLFCVIQPSICVILLC